MGHLYNRNIIIGVSGGIAAYKSAELVRLLRKTDASVRVIMSRGAQEFITPLTMQALSGSPVHTELLSETAELGMGHIELARWADVILIAPATADIIARLANGRADDLLTTVALATPAPILIAPAMNQQMWANTATTENIKTLTHRGITIVGPSTGEQACGDIGPGCLLEPKKITNALNALFKSNILSGRRVIITAGPTREPLDPARYISNHSSGKMGFALAQAAAEADAITTLITGPVNLETPDRVQRIDVDTAQAMLAAVQTELTSDIDIFIGAAAVADYRPAQIADQKIKKCADSISLAMVKNPDIIAAVASHPARPALVIGFAAETELMLKNARTKLLQKGLDMVIANDISHTDIGFNSDKNAVAIISKSETIELPMASKREIARRLIALFAETLE